VGFVLDVCKSTEEVVKGDLFLTFAIHQMFIIIANVDAVTVDTFLVFFANVNALAVYPLFAFCANSYAISIY